MNVRIGGIEITLACNSSQLLQELEQRYAAFLSSEAAGFKVSIRVTPPSPGTGAGIYPFPCVFQDGRLRFVEPAYTGFIDEQQGSGRLEIASVQPLEGVDYFLRVACSLLAFHAGGFLFHAAGIVHLQRAYLFFGHSGSGKTTVARLSPDKLILNDDLVMILPEGESWVVHATPFWNPSQVRPACDSAPLAGLYRLVQDQRVFLETLSRGQALAEIISSVPVILDDSARGAELLMRGRRLLDTVPIYRLHFLPRPDFWDVVLP